LSQHPTASIGMILRLGLTPPLQSPFPLPVSVPPCTDICEHVSVTAGAGSGGQAGAPAAAAVAGGSASAGAAGDGGEAGGAKQKGFSSFPGMPSGAFELSVLQKLQQKSHSKQ